MGRVKVFISFDMEGVARVGESGINALAALACQAPVGLITGDQQTISEADPFLPDAERVTVKESFTRFGARNLHPEGRTRWRCSARSWR